MKRTFPGLFLLLIFSLTALACQFGTATTYTTRVPAKVATRTPIAVKTATEFSKAANGSTATAKAPAAAPQEGVSAQDLTLMALFDRVNPGVVTIRVLTQTGGDLGTGFVYDKAGHILTNYHVVTDVTDLEVDFPSGLKVRGKVIGQDTDSDLAVIEVKAPAEALFPLTLGDSSKVKVGESVVAIGNPFGLSSSMTLGIVSAMGRTLDSIRQSAEGTSFSAGGIIQTDAAINPGNSGGPLLNLRGEVIGINRAIVSASATPGQEAQNSGVGFAVPINIVKRVTPTLIEKGSYDYPYMGMTTAPELSLFDQEALGLPQASGVYIISVAAGGPAEKAGLKGADQVNKTTGVGTGGDLIISVDGRPVQVLGDILAYLMENKSPGDQVAFTIFRNNEKKEVTLTLGKRP